ncbi:MAG: hypothetical protein Kow00129_00620 [Thermoleophilia bacterium]
MNLLERMSHAHSREEIAVRYQERSLCVYTRFGGAEIRPTRAFLWVGPRDARRERIVPLGLPPRLLKSGRRRRHISLGSWRVTVLGNPAVTVGQFAYYLIRRPHRRTA